MLLRLCFILCFCFVSAAPAFAADDAHRRMLARFALAAERQNLKPALPWITRFSFENRPAELTLADGQYLYRRPEVVHSAYDSSVTHDLGHFYRPSKPRMNMVAHYSGWHKGEVFTFGFDTGFSAAKIKMEPAFFIGYTRAFQVAELTHITLGVGSWFGGRVSEKPCLDSYDREYWCPALTAWTDYAPPRRRLSRYVHVVLTRRF